MKGSDYVLGEISLKIEIFSNLIFSCDLRYKYMLRFENTWIQFLKVLETVI